jgi:hypothetical protein
MAFPTGTILTANTILQVQRSAGATGTSRTLPTVTVTTSGTAALNATSIPVTAVVAPVGLSDFPAGGIVIQEGDKLTFNSTIPTTVTVTQDVLVGDTSISVKPITGALQSGNTATCNGLLRVLGLDDTSIKFTDKTVSSRSFENGLFDDNRKVMIGGSISCNGFFRDGDPSYSQILDRCWQTAEELYVRLTYPDGVYRDGFALLKGYSENNKLDEIRRATFELQFVGTINYGKVEV